MNDRPTVIILDYLMKDKLTYWLPVLVSQAVKIWWITKDVKKNLALDSIFFCHLLLISPNMD